MEPGIPRRLKNFLSAFHKFTQSQGLLHGLGYIARSIRLAFVPRLGVVSSKSNYTDLPEVELAFLVGRSDYEIASQVIQANILATMNPIRNLIVLTEDEEFSFASKSIEVTHIRQSEVLSPEALKKLRERMGVRTGWAIQQALKCYLGGTRDATLVIIDADTVFQNKTVFLDKNLAPMIPCIPSRNKNYDLALKKLGLGRKFYDFSHVMHFIVLSPEIAQHQLKELGLFPIEKCVETILSLDQVEFGVDYELMGEIMKRHSKEKNLVKLKNATAQRSRLLIRDSDVDSLSFHHYAQKA